MRHETPIPYESLLQSELLCAIGCTEPISIAYAAAVARKTLGAMPEELTVWCSGNLIKNAKAVILPGTGGMKGIEAAAALGALCGRADKALEVLEALGAEDIQAARALAESGFCRVRLLKSDIRLHIIVEAAAQGHSALVEISHLHTHIAKVCRDGAVLQQDDAPAAADPEPEQRPMSVAGIVEYADTAGLATLAPLLERQIDCNMRIAEQGMQGGYGLGIGKLWLSGLADTAEGKACAYTAAASEARMDGCHLPVVINSGSGNQGITSSVPVIVYARAHGCSHQKLLRALIVSNLVAIHIKQAVGRLSAFCGVVSAACGSGAGITYLLGGSLQQIGDTITNTLANVSGIICDGAKPSCAAKAASSVQAALLSHRLAMEGKRFCAGDGIIKEDVETTIACVGKLAREGMQETDQEILSLMLQ